MDVRNWSLDQIMQLPDSWFGRRFQVSVTPQASTGQTAWDISELALPEQFVLWEVLVYCDAQYYNVDYMRLALGDQVPTTAAQMTALEAFLKNLGRQGADPRNIGGPWRVSWALRNLKMPFKPNGRRLVGEVTATGTGGAYVTTVITVSTIPTEVPDCLISV